jgi:hypothetical protein
MKAPNPKHQTPKKPQASSSKSPKVVQVCELIATPGSASEFGVWNFFGVWCLVFGVFPPPFAA